MIRNFYTPGHKIQRATQGQDAYGAPSETWADYLDVEGKLWQLKGDERMSADKDTYFADSMFATDIADITEKDRYVDPDGVIYDIKAIAPRTRPDGTGHMELLLELVR